jgi:hypothetical protein
MQCQCTVAMHLTLVLLSVNTADGIAKLSTATEILLDITPNRSTQ